MKTYPASRYRTYKSQTILEIVLSIGLAAMVLSALLILGAASSKTVASSLKRSQATKLAVAGLEAVRYLRDTSGYGSLQNGCYEVLPSGIQFKNAAPCSSESVSPGDNSQNTFGRTIAVQNYGANTNTKQVTVVVTWEESQGNKEIELTTVLSKW